VRIECPYELGQTLYRKADGRKFVVDVIEVYNNTGNEVMVRVKDMRSGYSERWHVDLVDEHFSQYDMDVVAFQQFMCANPTYAVFQPAIEHAWKSGAAHAKGHGRD
jgi:hypothetical protein